MCERSSNFYYKNFKTEKKNNILFVNKNEIHLEIERRDF